MCGLLLSIGIDRGANINLGGHRLQKIEIIRACSSICCGLLTIGIYRGAGRTTACDFMAIGERSVGILAEILLFARVRQMLVAGWLQHQPVLIGIGHSQHPNRVREKA